MESLCMGILGSALIAILYGFFVAQKEEQIRQRLNIRRKGWIKKRYILAFVGAVRGRAATTEIAVIGFLVLLIPLLLTGYFWTVARSIEKSASRLDKTYSGYLTSNSSNSLEKTSVHEEIKASAYEWHQMKIQVRWAIVAGKILAGVGLVAYWIGNIFWLPFILMRRRFAFEIERFTLRIQGLADKTELANLAIAEAQVKDEDTLRQFVHAMRSVSEQHGMLELVKTFDLWNDSSKH